MIQIVSSFTRFIPSIAFRPQSLIKFSNLQNIMQYLPIPISQNALLLNKQRSVCLYSSKSPFQIKWQESQNYKDLFSAPQLVYAGDCKNHQVSAIYREIKKVKLNPDEVQKSDALFDLCRDLAQFGDLDEAIKTALAISDKSKKNIALWNLSEMIEKIGDRDKAIEILQLISNEEERKSS